MKKCYLLVITTALSLLACGKGYATESALAAERKALIHLAIEKVSNVVVRAKNAGLTHDQTVALVAQSLDNDAQLSSGIMSDTQRKVVLSALTVVVVAYVVASCYQGTAAFWEWKWLGQQKKDSTLSAEQQAALDFLVSHQNGGTGVVRKSSAGGAISDEPQNPAVILE